MRGDRGGIVDMKFLLQLVGQEIQERAGVWNNRKRQVPQQPFAFRSTMAGRSFRLANRVLSEVQLLCRDDTVPINKFQTKRLLCPDLLRQELADIKEGAESAAMLLTEDARSVA